MRYRRKVGLALMGFGLVWGYMFGMLTGGDVGVYTVGWFYQMMAVAALGGGAALVITGGDKE